MNGKNQMHHPGFDFCGTDKLMLPVKTIMNFGQGNGGFKPWQEIKTRILKLLKEPGNNVQILGSG